MKPPSDAVLTALAIVLRTLAFVLAVSAATWVVLDVHSIATDARDIARELKYMRATYEGRKAACEELAR